MKILVFSDSHGKTNGLINVMNRIKPDMFLHLGDCYSDAEEVHLLFENIDYAFVNGNCDIYNESRLERVIHVGGKIMYMTHGHIVDLSKKGALVSKAAAYNPDIILHGHTHVPHISNENGTIIMNPGSASRNRQLSSEPTFGLIEIINCNIICQVLFIDEMLNLAQGGRSGKPGRF